MAARRPLEGEFVMPEISRRWIVIALLVAGVSFAGPSLADNHESTAEAAGPAENVKLTFRMGQLDGNKRTGVKSYDLVVISGGIGSRLLSGARIPFPADEDDDDDPEWVYQNIGFTTEVHAWVLEDGRIKVIATLEDSSVVAGAGDAPPHVETRQLSINAVLTDGKPLEVGRIDGIRDRSGFVEVEATILR
jgi:Flp pilus assembly secretin CpaC